MKYYKHFLANLYAQGASLITQALLIYSKSAVPEITWIALMASTAMDSAAICWIRIKNLSSKYAMQTILGEAKPRSLQN